MVRYLKTLLPLLVLGALMASPAADRIYPGNWGLPAGNLPEEVFEWKPPEHSFETSTLFILNRMDNGGWLYVNLFTFRIPVVQKWGVSVTIIGPDGKRRFFKEEIPQEEVETKPGTAYIRLGKNVFEGNAPNYSATLDVGGCKANLRFSNSVPTWRPGDGVMYYTPDKEIFKENSVMLPFSRVSGQLEYKGVKMDAAGWGYGDRAYTNLNYFRQNEMIYAVRGFPKNNDNPGYAVSMLEYKAHRSYGGIRVPWIILMGEDGYIIATKNFKLKKLDYRTDPKTGYSYPWRMEMTGQDRGCSFRLVSQAERLDEVFDVIDEFPSYLRPIVRKFFSRPVFYRFCGTITGVITTKDGKKIHIELDGSSSVTFIQNN